MITVLQNSVTTFWHPEGHTTDAKAAEMTRSRQPVYVRIGMLGIGTYVPSEWPVSYSVFEDHGVWARCASFQENLHVYTWDMMKGQGVSLPDRVRVRVTHAATLSFE